MYGLIRRFGNKKLVVAGGFAALSVASAMPGVNFEKSLPCVTNSNSFLSVEYSGQGKDCSWGRGATSQISLGETWCCDSNCTETWMKIVQRGGRLVVL
eukprot:sb/3478918/